MPEVDDDQLAALRRLRAAFGFVQIIEVVRHDPAVSDDVEDDRGGAQGELGEGGEDGRPEADDP